MTSASHRRLAELGRALGLGDDPQVILHSVREVYAEVDARVAAGAEGLELPCAVGCDACCHEAVFVSAPELLAVAAEIFEWPAKRRRDLVLQMLRFAELFEDELELLETLPAGPERDEVAMRVQFRCPLLGADRACSVYAARELNGRTFGQSIDEQRDAAYGCGLTHERLRVLPEAAPRQLFGARAARGILVDRLPGTDLVHVYPWWFARYREIFLFG